MTLRARIAAVAGVAVAIVVVVTAVFTYVAVRSQLRGELDDSLRSLAGSAALERLAPLAGAPPGEPPFMERERLSPDRLQPDARPFGGLGAAVQLLTPRGVVAPPGEIALPSDAGARTIARRGEGDELTDMDVEGTHLRVLTRGAAPGVAVRVARPLDEIDDQLGRILVALIAIGAVGITGGVGLGALVARTALVPIARFTSRTEALREDPDLSQRMDVVGDDELARLARSFNANLDALERSVQSQRQLVADASHELRTPIASLRANIQVLQDAQRLPDEERARMRDDIVGELDDLTALVGDVVELARGAEPPEELDDVRLDELVAAIVDREQRRNGRRAELRSRLEPTLVQGDPARIGRAVSNLFGNAVKWSPPGAPVEVELRGGVLSVRDHGPGFEPEDMPHVFERFYRAASARGTSGSGLGLAIVRRAAEAHGGFAEASNAAGGGALLRVGFGPPLSLDGPTDEILRHG